jgi:hypothetical protein
VRQCDSTPRYNVVQTWRKMLVFPLGFL